MLSNIFISFTIFKLQFLQNFEMLQIFARFNFYGQNVREIFVWIIDKTFGAKNTRQDCDLLTTIFVQHC